MGLHPRDCPCDACFFADPCARPRRRARLAGWIAAAVVSALLWLWPLRFAAQLFHLLRP